MKSLVEEAKDVLTEVQLALQEPPSTRASHAILLLPKVEHALDSMLSCVEYLTTRDAKAIEPRKELKESLTALRAEIWHINDQVAKITGFTTDERVPVAPLTRLMVRALTAMELIESLLNIPSDEAKNGTKS